MAVGRDFSCNGGADAPVAPGSRRSDIPLEKRVQKVDEKPLLAVRNLSVSFKTDRGWREIVKSVSFAVEARETVALVGESGSGKSVTALSLLRLTPPGISRCEGEAVFGGRNLLKLPEGEMLKVRGNDIAMIFQEPMTSLNPVLTIGRQICEVLRVHRDCAMAEAEAEAVRLLDKVRIPAARSRLKDYPHRLSGGMRQRVMIAIALACRPKLLIADEPTTALDVTIQAQILGLIRSLQDEDEMSVFFITHDMGVVAEVADRTIVMYDGEAVESGQTEKIFNRADHPYTRALLASVPRLGTMQDAALPSRFPIVDTKTGRVVVSPDRRDTVRRQQPALLEVMDLTTRFEIRGGFLGRLLGRVHAVEGVSFSLAAGETLSLVGESGCGKSTTGRSVLRLLEPQSGSVRLEGEDVLSFTRERLRQSRRLMQMIFQDPFASLDPRIPIGDAIMEPLLVNRLTSRTQARDRAAELLKRVGLSPDMAKRHPHQFSGGQRQRICIARALALGPKLIVADEAVSALDVSVKAQVINLMLDLQSEFGLGYLFISHDMAVVERVSHRVAVMYLGEIVEIGPRLALFGNPQHPYTRRLLQAVPVPDPARRLIRRTLSNDEIKSPIRRPDYVPPPRTYREISPGHLVQEWGNEWESRRTAEAA
jgi:peptide/nickel transport system ATP-binding protein